MKLGLLTVSVKHTQDTKIMDDGPGRFGRQVGVGGWYYKVSVWGAGNRSETLDTKFDDPESAKKAGLERASEMARKMVEEAEAEINAMWPG